MPKSPSLAWFLELRKMLAGLRSLSEGDVHVEREAEGGGGGGHCTGDATRRRWRRGGGGATGG